MRPVIIVFPSAETLGRPIKDPLFDCSYGNIVSLFTCFQVPSTVPSAPLSSNIYTAPEVVTDELVVLSKVNLFPFSFIAPTVSICPFRFKSTLFPKPSCELPVRLKRVSVYVQVPETFLYICTTPEEKGCEDNFAVVANGFSKAEPLSPTAIVLPSPDILIELSPKCPRLCRAFIPLSFVTLNVKSAAPPAPKFASDIVIVSPKTFPVPKVIGITEVTLPPDETIILKNPTVPEPLLDVPVTLVYVPTVLRASGAPNVSTYLC